MRKERKGARAEAYDGVNDEEITMERLRQSEGEAEEEGEGEEAGERKGQA